MAETDNLYELLELDPSDVGWEAVERRLAEKREQWSRDLNQGSPRRRQQAAALLERLKEAGEVLRDPEERKRQAAELLHRREAARGEARRRLESKVKLLAGGGTCSRAQWGRLVEELGEHFTPDEIGAALRRAGVEPPGPAIRPPELRLDPTEVRKIRDRLELLGHEDLFAFLGVGADASPEALVRAADEVLRKQRNAARADATTTARRDLAVLCSRLFADEEGKARYERQRLFERLSPLDPGIELAGSGGRLTAAQVAALVDEAKAAGIEPDVARAYVLEVAEERGWPVESAAPDRGPAAAKAPDPETGGSESSAAAEAAAAAAGAARPEGSGEGSPRRETGASASSGASQDQRAAAGAGGEGAGASSGATPGRAMTPWRRRFAAASVLLMLGSGSFGAVQTGLLSSVVEWWVLRGSDHNGLSGHHGNGNGSNNGSNNGGNRVTTTTSTQQALHSGKLQPPKPLQGGTAPPSGGTNLPAPVPPTATPPPATAPASSRRVAVLVDTGGDDSGLGDAIAAGLLEELRRLGLYAQGSASSLLLDGLGSPLPPLANLLPTLRQEGFGFVVRITSNVEPSRQLSSFAGGESAYRARVRVNAFRVPAGSGVGMGWNETVEFTAADVERAGQEVTDRIGAEVAVAISDAP